MKSVHSWLLVIAALFCTALNSSAQEKYFSTQELPDLIKCLPAPPDTMSEHFVHDIMRYTWGKQQRLNPERAAIARRDAVWTYEALFAEFSVPFGLTISKTETPEIWKLLVTSLQTTDQMRVAPKKYYHRMRPYVRFHEHILTNGQEEDEVELGREGSYPSGHTARGWTTALLLAEINPVNANDIFARGWMYGESRVIVGAHWQSDVDVTRVAASIGYSRLQTSPDFRAQMDKAKAEYKAKTKNRAQAPVVSAPSVYDSSAFVNITDVVPDAILEIRYFSTYNFVGRRIDGYLEPVALMTKKAAEALRQVSEDLKAQGYRLKIYDAYRPQQAVDHFVRWASDLNDVLMKPYFYPELNKNVLIPDYIASKSGHSRGSTIDLTLFDMKTEKELDMGGTFDWFGVESHPDFCGNPDTGKYTGGKSPAGRTLTAEQFEHRMILRRAMIRRGFMPLDTEWWHFRLKDEPFPNTFFNFPVKALKQ